MKAMTAQTTNFQDGAASERVPRSVTGGPRGLLRAEGAALAVAAALAYARLDLSWVVFAAAFLAPDLAFAGYAFGSRAGAAVYNVAHSTLAPLVLGLLALIFANPVGQAAALIWLAHVGFDRALGYGLKYSSGFGDTHLGRIGRS
jgi:hypothetical protein